MNSRWEIAPSGLMREMNERLAADPELAAQYRMAHERYLARFGDLTIDEQPACTTLEYFPGSINWTGTLTSIVAVSKGPTTKDDCKKNGWKAFGFKNQGQCVSYVNHLP